MINLQADWLNYLERIYKFRMKVKHILLGFIVLLLAVTAYTLLRDNSSPRPAGSTVSINSAVFVVEIANTPEEKTKGLGYRNSLPHDQSMVFIFDNPGHYSFWMHGMRFPLDIIFILNDKVVGVYENLPPAPDTDPSPPTWGGNLLADRVLEVNAGLARKYNIKVGDKVVYNIKN